MILLALGALAASSISTDVHPLLAIPSDLATATPVWHPDGTNAEYIMLRTEVKTEVGKKIQAAVAFVTAKSSPYCKPDDRLKESDYGACIPHGGTSFPKLLGAYKLFVNGVLCGMGPGRLTNQTQPVDAIDVTSLIRADGNANAVGIEGYHLQGSGGLFADGYGGRLLARIVITYADNTTTTVNTNVKDGGWQIFNAMETFNPTGSSGAWAGNSGFPHEYIDVRAYPTGWTLPGFNPAPSSVKWTTSLAAQPAFELQFGGKLDNARPLEMFSRIAANVSQLSGGRLLIDYSRTIQGGVNLTLVAAYDGQQVVVSLGEELQSDGSIKEPMRTGNTFVDTWTLQKGVNIVSQHEYIEFRYAMLSPCAATPSPPSPNPHPHPSPQPPSPPRSPVQCVSEIESNTVHLGCNKGTIDDILFASFGTPTGVCSNGPNSTANTFKFGSCNEDNTVSILKNLCIGKPACTVPISPAFFGEPCHHVPKKLDAAVSCTTLMPKHHDDRFWLIDQGEQPHGSGDGSTRSTMREALPTTPTAACNNTLPAVSKASSWIVRYPLSDAAEDLSMYNDVAALTPSAFRKPVGLATFASSNASLNSVWELARYTLVAASLDVNTDSNVRQRDLCHTDAFIAGLGQLAISDSHGTVGITAADGYQIDSNIWQGTLDFRSALISLTYFHSMYTGNTALLRQRYSAMKLHSMISFFDPAAGLLVKSADADCPESWSPAGLPAGVYESLKPKCGDLIDWPSGSRDGYVSSHNTQSAVPNAYAAVALSRMSAMAGWLGNTADQEQWANTSSTIVATMKSKLYNSSSGNVKDGVGVNHYSIHASMFAAVAGIADGDAAMADKIAAYIVSRGATEACSCMGAYWMLEALYRLAVDSAAAADAALDVLTSDRKNSWLHMIEQGATTTMEAWTPDEKPNLTWSHPWCSSPNNVMIRLLLGLQPMERRWARISLMPQPASLQTVHVIAATSVGPIEVLVEQQLSSPQTISATLDVPSGSTAHVCLPPAHGSAASAATTLKLDGAVVNSVAKGRLLCLATDASSGKHTVLRE